MHNGDRLRVGCGESIIRDAGVNSAGYDLTATGTAYVPLASYTIPAGMIGDGEQWEADVFGRTLGVHASGSDALGVRVASSRCTALYLSSNANRVIRTRGSVVRVGTTLIVRDSTQPDIYGDVFLADATIDFGAAITVDAGWSPGAATNTMRLRQWVFRRIG